MLQEFDEYQRDVSSQELTIVAKINIIGAPAAITMGSWPRFGLVKRMKVSARKVAATPRNHRSVKM
jgi:hypothetical protein